MPDQKPSEHRSELAGDLRVSRIIPIISMAVVLGILLVIFEVSFASMIFSGTLKPFASRAAGLTLAGVFVLCLVGAIGSSFKGIIPMPQDAPTAILSTIAVSILAAMGPGTPAEVQFMTVTAAIALSAFVTGICYLMVGRFRLANLLRFMPYPVVGGFLAGTGWLLAAGSIGVMCDVSLSPANLISLIAPATLIKWLPGVIFGTLMFGILLKNSGILILPTGLIAGTLLFYLVLSLSGTSIIEAKKAGFLISGVPSKGLWPAFTFSDLSQIRWEIAIGQLPSILSVALVSIVGMLLNMSGIEVGARGELDINDEIMVTGTGNLLAGACGSVPGYPSISLSLLSYKAGADSRLTGFFSALVVGIVLFFGGDLLGYFPKCLLGGLVFFLGLSLIYDWIFMTWRRLPLIDWLIVAFIFLIIGLFGFLEGVASGLVATIIFFVFRFSRLPVVKQTFTAADRVSLKARSVPHRYILKAEAEKLIGYELTGYLFFGSVSSLVDSLKATLKKDPGPNLMLLDFSLVTGFDISAINTFQQVVLAAGAGGCSIIFTSVSDRFKEAITRNFSNDILENVSFFKTINDGLEWCEDSLIRNMEAVLSRKTSLKDAIFDRSVDEALIQLERQEYVENLAHDLTAWVLERKYPPGSVLVEQGQPEDTLQLLTWGNAIAIHPESGQLIRSLEQGCVIEGAAAFSPNHTCSSTILADSECRTAALTTESRQRLEKENPELALRLYSYLIQSASDL